MDIRHLATFVGVVHHGTLNATARALGYSQAAVTLHIQQLERHLGATLFDRVGKLVVLTPLGQRVHERAVQILGAVDELKHEAAALADGQVGHLRVGSIEPTASKRLPMVLHALRMTQPGIEVRVEVGGTGTMTSHVASGDLDFALTTPPPPALNLQFEPLFDEHLVVVARREDSNKMPARLTASRLSQHSIVLTENGCAYRQAIERAFASKGVSLAIVLEMGSIEAIVECVREGLGVGIMPSPAVTATDKGLITRTIADLPLAVPVGLTSRKQFSTPLPLAQVVRNHFREKLTLPTPADRERRQNVTRPTRRRRS